MTSYRALWNSLARWKKMLLQSAAALILYAIFGFVLLPRIISHVLTDSVGPALHRTLRVGDVRCNPFALTIDLEDMHLQDRQSGDDFAALAALHLDLELSSLFRLALVVHDISLDGPRAHIRIESDGSTNFADLTAANATDSKDDSARAAIFPFIVEPFSLTNGTVVIEDRIKNATHTIDGIAFTIPHLSSRRTDWDTFAKPTLSFRLNGAPFALHGQTTPFADSLKTDFRMDMVDLALPAYWAYVPARSNLQLGKGSLTLDTTLIFEQHENRLPTFSIQGTIIGKDIELTDSKRPVLSAERAEIVMDDISVLSQKLGLRSVILQRPYVEVVRARDGSLNWATYFTPTGRPASTGNATTPAATNATTPPLVLQAPEIRISDGRMVYRDETTAAPFIKDITALELAVTDLSTAENATTTAKLQARTAQGEEIALDGSIGLTPFQARVNVTARNLNLPSYAPYYAASLPVTLASALADTRLTLALNATDKALRLDDSAFELRDLDLKVPGAADGMRLKRLTLDKIAVDLSGRTVRTGLLNVENATVSTGRDKTGRSTLLALLGGGNATSTNATPADPAARSAPWTVQSDGLTLSGATLQVAGDRIKEPARIALFKVGPLSMDSGRQTANVSSVELSCGLDLVRGKGGDINLATLLAGSESVSPENPGKMGKRSGAQAPLKPNTKASGKSGPGSSATSKNASPVANWNATLGQVALTDSSVAFTDESLIKPMRLSMDQIALHTRNVTMDQHASLPLDLSCRVEERGTIHAEGSVVPAGPSSTGSVTLSGLPVTVAAAYAADVANIDIPAGTLSGKLDWRMGGKDADQIGGDLRLEGLRVTEGRAKNEIVGLTALHLRDAAVRLSPLAISIREVDLTEPRGTFLIDDKGHTTLDRIKPALPAPAKTAVESPASPGLTSLRVDGIRIRQGRFAFADKSLSPQFESVVAPVDIQVSGFSLEPDTRPNLTLSAMVGGSAPLNATGWIAPLKSPLEAESSVTLKNLDLVALSPYSTKFIAYPVTRGQLDWDMNIKAETDKLAMGNAIRARQLELGDKAEVPGAADVPIKLGLALLRDMNGDVAINLPVRGDLKDPQFNIGGIVAQAFVGLIVKAIASPFSLLASLVPTGNGSQDMSRIPFPPGLSIPASETLPLIGNVGTVLSQRPGLRLVVVGHAAPEADRQALAELLFRRKLQVIKYDDLPRKEREKTKPEDLPIADAEYADLLWTAYKNEPVSKEKNALGMTKDVPQEVQEAKLRELIQVTDEDLAQLAARRAEFVKTHLIQDLKADAGRVFLGPGGPPALSGQHDVTLEIQH